MRWVALLVSIAAGCVQPDLVPCGELACSSTQLCHAGACVSPEQLAQCDGMPEGTACTAPTVGHCVDAICQPSTCGDGYVDSDLREVCEPGLVTPLYCTDLGFDEGRPGCVACQADVSTGCIQYGWTRVAPLNVPTRDYWTDGSSYIAIPQGLAAPVRWHSATFDTTLTIPSAGDIRRSASGRTFIVAYGAVYELRDGTISAMFPATGLIDFAVDDNGLGYLVTGQPNAGCMISTLDTNGVLSPLVSFPDRDCDRVFVGPGPTPRVFLSVGMPTIFDVTPTELWELDRGTSSMSFVHSFSAPINVVADDVVGATETLWIGTGNGLFTITGPFFAQIDSGPSFSAIVFIGDRTFANSYGGEVGRYNRSGTVKTGQRFSTPGGFGLTTDGARLYSFGGPVYRFNDIIWGERTPLDASLLVVDGTVRSDGQQVALTLDAIYTPRGDGRALTPWSTYLPTMRAIASEGSRYVVSVYYDDTTDRQAGLADATALNGAFTRSTIPGDPLVDSLWLQPSTSALFAAGNTPSGGWLGIRRGITWETKDLPGCTVRSVRNAVAAGGCATQATLWRYDGSAWLEQTAPPLEGPLEAVAVLGDGSLAVVGMHGAGVYDGTAWTVDTDAVGDAISGTARDDIYISGPYTDVQHYNGVYWSRLSLSEVSPIVVLATPHSVLFPGAGGGSVEIVR